MICTLFFEAAPRLARLSAESTPVDRRRGLPIAAAVIAFLVMLAGAGAAHSQTQSSFDDADTNHDGRVTLQEFEAYVTKRLEGTTGPVARRFKRLSPQEQEARLRNRFEKADRGHKGYLDSTDWDAAWDAAVSARGERPGVPRNGLSLGLAVIETDPGYVGFRRQTTPVPLITYRSGRFFFSGAEGGVIAAQSDGYTLSFRLVPQLNRVSASDSPELAGIKTREWTLDGGVDLSVQQPWGNASFAVLHDILGRNHGTEIRANYAYPIRLGTGWLIPTAVLSWQSENLTNYYYGVSPAESLPNRPTYSPGPALSPTAQLGYFVPVSDKWLLGAEVGYTRFGSAITDSPIVDRSGSLSGMILFTYSFSSGADAAAPPITPLKH